MAFSKFECLVLSQVEFDARVSSEAVARRLGTRTERVSRTRQRLIERGSIIPRAFINSLALGYVDVKLFFSLATCSAQRRNRVLQTLAAEPGMAWIGSYAGEYRYGLSYQCHNPLELNDLLDKIGNQFPDLFSAKNMLLRKSFTAFQQVFPGISKGKRAELALEWMKDVVKIDALDYRILYELGGKPLVSLRDLARILGEVPSTVVRHVERLEKMQVIAGYYYAFDPVMLGFELYRLLLNFSSLTRERRAQLYDFTRRHSQSVYIIESLGNWDFELGFHAARAKDINNIVNTIYEAFGDTLQDLKILTELEELHSHYFPFKE